MILYELLQFKDLLVSLVIAQDDIKLGERGLILILLSLHEGIVLHQSLNSIYLLEDKLVETSGVVLTQHIVRISLDHVRVLLLIAGFGTLTHLELDSAPILSIGRWSP